MYSGGGKGKSPSLTNNKDIYQFQEERKESMRRLTWGILSIVCASCLASAALTPPENMGQDRTVQVEWTENGTTMNMRYWGDSLNSQLDPTTPSASGPWIHPAAYQDPVLFYINIPNFQTNFPKKTLNLQVNYTGSVSVFRMYGYTPEINPIWGTLISDNSTPGKLNMNYTFTPNPYREEIILELQPGTSISEIGIYTQCIPEPATLTLFSLGALALIRRKK